MAPELDPLGLLRASDHIWMTSRPDLRRVEQPTDTTRRDTTPEDTSLVDTGTTLVLGGSPARYWRLRPASTAFLQELADLAQGMTVREAQSKHPAVNFEGLAEAKFVHYLPPAGQSVPTRLVTEVWRRNISARTHLARHGWQAVSELMLAPTTQSSTPTCRRPLLLDQIEAAARLSFGLPGTSRKCTVVARAICIALRSRGYPAHVVVLGARNQTFMHARTVLGDEPVDPNDELLEGDTFVPLRP